MNDTLPGIGREYGRIVEISLEGILYADKKVLKKLILKEGGNI
jgi:hypothetical protein